MVVVGWQGGRGKRIAFFKHILQNLNIPGYIVSINPSLVDKKREDQMLKALQIAINITPVSLQNAYNENIIPNKYIPVGTTFYALNENTKQAILKFPGVKVDEYPSRIYTAMSRDVQNVMYYECCTRLYSSFNYHGVAGVEKKYDKVLSGEDGGSLVLLNEKGENDRTIIKKQPKNGQEINIK